MNHKRKRPRRQLKLRKLRKTHQPCAAQPDALKPKPSDRRRMQEGGV